MFFNSQLKDIQDDSIALQIVPLELLPENRSSSGQHHEGRTGFPPRPQTAAAEAPQRLKRSGSAGPTQRNDSYRPSSSPAALSSPIKRKMSRPMTGDPARHIRDLRERSTSLRRVSHNDAIGTELLAERPKRCSSAQSSANVSYEVRCPDTLAVMPEEERVVPEDSSVALPLSKQEEQHAAPDILSSPFWLQYRTVMNPPPPVIFDKRRALALPAQKKPPVPRLSSASTSGNLAHRPALTTTTAQHAAGENPNGVYRSLNGSSLSQHERRTTPTDNEGNTSSMFRKASEVVDQRLHVEFADCAEGLAMPSFVSTAKVQKKKGPFPLSK